MMRGLVGAVLMFSMTAPPAAAASPDDLTCLDDQLDDKQRAAVGALFAEQTDDPTDERKLAKGSDAAAADFAVAIGGCANRFNWNDVQRAGAEQYLIRLGSLSQIAVAKGENWALPMEVYAPFGLRLLLDHEEITEHQRVMVAAGAKANGVPARAGDEDESSSIIKYLLAKADVDAARKRFEVM